MPPATYEEIVGCSEQPTLVLAAPGAGKTTLLADRFKGIWGQTFESAVKVGGV